MIPTKVIREALVATLITSALFEKVIAHAEADLGAALEALRDSPSSLAIVVPGEDTYTHKLTEGLNAPEFCEVRNTFELLITSRTPDMRVGHSGDACVDLKDATCEALLWSDLSIPDLICLPQGAEPMVIAIENQRGRELWKITLEIRTLIYS